MCIEVVCNSVALEKDEEQVSFINMRIKALWECPDQDEEVGAKHIAEGERFQAASLEPIPPLAGEQGELLEDPNVASLTKEDAETQNSEGSSQNNSEENDSELIAM